MKTNRAIKTGIKRTKITISLDECNLELESGPLNDQCPELFYFYNSGDVVFCLRPEGHKGDHRGLRVQWTNGTTNE